MPSPTAAPTVSSTVGLKNLVIAPVTADTEESTTYGDLQKVAGAIEATITPENNDPDVQYFDDTEGDVLYPDPELSFTTRLADLPLVIQEMIFGNQIDDNGVLIRSANDKPGYFAVGFMSEKANGKYRFVWLYKVRAKPVTESYATKEGTPSRSRKATPPRRARPLPGRPARSNGRRSREPRMGAIRPLPMKARAALILPRLRPSLNPSIRPRSRRRKMGRNCPHHNIPRLPFFRRALSLPLYRAYGRARA